MYTETIESVHRDDRECTLETIKSVHRDQHAPCAHSNHFHLSTTTQKEPQILCLLLWCSRPLQLSKMHTRTCTHRNRQTVIDADSDIDRHRQTQTYLDRQRQTQTQKYANIDTHRHRHRHRHRHKYRHKHKHRHRRRHSTATHRKKKGPPVFSSKKRCGSETWIIYLLMPHSHECLFPFPRLLSSKKVLEFICSYTYSRACV